MGENERSKLQRIVRSQYWRGLASPELDLTTNLSTKTVGHITAAWRANGPLTGVFKVVADYYGYLLRSFKSPETLTASYRDRPIAAVFLFQPSLLVETCRA